MKTFISLSLLLISCSSWALTLKEAFQAAIENTATIKDRKYSEEIAKQQERQAIGSVLPTIAAVSTNTWRDEVPGVGPFGEGYQHFGALNLRQPLFQGGAEYYALKVAGDLPEIARYQREQEELVLYSMVAQAFYQVVRLESDEKVYQEQKNTLLDRVKTLQERAKIGRSKLTDVLAARSQLARVTAEFSRVEQQLVSARKDLKNLTGLDRLGQLQETFHLPNLKISPNWQKGLLKTPRVRANELLLKNARREVEGARGTFLPTVDMDANYFLDRAGILRESVWEVTVNARWEIFSGGRDLSEIRIRNLQALQLEAQLTDLKRTLQNDYSALKDEFIMNQKIIREMEEAVRLAQENYQRHLREANQGLVSDLEALRVLEEYLQIRRSYDQQLFALKVGWANLQALAGEKP